MKLRTLIILFITHLIVSVAGFTAGIYLLPIIIAPVSPSTLEINQMNVNNNFSGVFSREREDSDFLHWGEGNVSVNKTHVTLIGKIAPGPDYKLYLSPDFVETEEKFRRLKPSMVLLGDVRTFENFVVNITTEIDLLNYNTVVVWCETFGEFITSAKYR